MGSRIDLAGDVAMTKFAALRDRYRKLKKELLASKTSGAGVNEVKKITWPYYATLDGMFALGGRSEYVHFAYFTLRCRYFRNINVVSRQCRHVSNLDLQLGDPEGEPDPVFL